MEKVLDAALLGVWLGGWCQLMPRDLSDMDSHELSSAQSALAETSCHLLVESHPLPPAGLGRPGLLILYAAHSLQLQGRAGRLGLPFWTRSPRFSSATGTGPVCVAGDVALAPVPWGEGEMEVCSSQLHLSSHVRHN